jgi:hypothetical protein
LGPLTPVNATTTKIESTLENRTSRTPQGSRAEIQILIHLFFNSGFIKGMKTAEE